MKNTVQQQKQSGFTIIELMIATTVFSVVLMICLAGVLQITKMYYRGVTQNKTREAARSITDEISEAIRFSSGTISIPSGQVSGPQVDPDDDSPDVAVGYFCIGQKRYTYAIDRQMKENPSVDTRLKHKKHVLWVDQPETCSQAEDLDNPRTDLNGRDLLQENMRLYSLQIQQLTKENGTLLPDTYRIDVGVAYGDNDLLRPKADRPDELSCEGTFAGVEFCATTKYSVIAEKRL